MKLTKKCALPWRFMQIHAGGMMQCCAVQPDTDIGDFILDYCNQPEDEQETDPFNNEGLQALRKGLLTGNLRPMCRDCFFVANEYVTTEYFEEELKKLLRAKNPDIDLDNADLTKVHAFDWAAISFTNRCNLSCIYCVQSVHKDTNPFFKMEFPYEYAQKTLDYLAAQGLRQFSTCVEGEATLYRHWYELISKFHKDHPEVRLRMTTNLNRRFSNEEIELLTEYTNLDVSIDTLDPVLYSELRRNGNLDLVLENIELILSKLKEQNKSIHLFTLHTVLSDKTWESLEELADYAFERNISIEIGDYEERGNTLAYREKLLKPISQMDQGTQTLAYEAIKRVKEKGEKLGLRVGTQGQIFSKIKAQVTKNYNVFAPYDDNPVFKRFYDMNPTGTEGSYLSIAYDVDNISHEGIMVLRGNRLHIEGLDNTEYVILREIQIFKEGKKSTRYGQTTVLRYRRKIDVIDGVLDYEVSYNNDDIDTILVEVVDWKECSET